MRIYWLSTETTIRSSPTSTPHAISHSTRQARMLRIYLDSASTFVLSAPSGSRVNITWRRTPRERTTSAGEWPRNSSFYRKISLTVETARLRLLEEEPHSQKLAEAAVGLGVAENWKGHIKRADNQAEKMETENWVGILDTTRQFEPIHRSSLRSPSFQTQKHLLRRPRLLTIEYTKATAARRWGSRESIFFYSR